jgi:hypothetical protein
MGTYYGYNTKQNMIDNLIQGSNLVNDKGDIVGRRKIIAHSLRGNNLWCVNEHTYTDGRPTISYIMLYRLSCYKGEWGYKPMDESMGPYYYDCPKKFLKMAGPPMNEWSKDWREKVLHPKMQEVIPPTNLVGAGPFVNGI